MTEFNLNIELRTIQKIAMADLVAARILWNTGLIAQSLWMLQQSAEKYLKCLWAKDQIFESERDFQKRLHDLNHDFSNIFKSLRKEYQNKIPGSLYIISISNLRYNGNFCYDYSQFKSSEKFINHVRKLLGEKIKKNHLQEWENVAIKFSNNHKQNTKAIKVVQSIFSLTNSMTKKEKRAHKRRWDKIISSLK